MELFVLGSGGMMPMPHRFLTSVAMRLRGRIYLFDCGEGTQLPYKTSPLGMRSLDVICISHLHADHILGLPGMMMLRAQMPDAAPLTLIGPPGLATFVNNIRADLGMYIDYDVKIIEWTKGTEATCYHDNLISIKWGPLDHSVFCLGYRVIEHDLPGRFDESKAVALDVERGPKWGKLQAGEVVTSQGGLEVKPEDVLGQSRRGRVMSFTTDTRLTDRLVPLIEGADIAFIESMFAASATADAKKKGHMTVVQSATVARNAGVEQLVLVHISPRYLGAAVKAMQKDAQGIFPGAQIARDGDTFELPVPQ